MEIDKQIDSIYSDQYGKILLQLIAGAGLADHLGDITNDIDAALKRLELDIEWDELSELMDYLGNRGVTTVHGTSLVDDDYSP